MFGLWSSRLPGLHSSHEKSPVCFINKTQLLTISKSSKSLHLNSTSDFPEPQTAHVCQWALLWKSTRCVSNFSSIVFLLTVAFIVKEQRFSCPLSCNISLLSKLNWWSRFLLSFYKTTRTSLFFVSEVSPLFLFNSWTWFLVIFSSIRSSFSLQVRHLPLYSSLLEKMSILSSLLSANHSLPFLSRSLREDDSLSSSPVPSISLFFPLSSAYKSLVPPPSRRLSLSVLAVETRTDWLWDLTRAKTGCQQVMIET